MNNPDSIGLPIHLIFKTHLDIGFTDHAEKVRQRYHAHFLPQAMDTAEHFHFENPDHPQFRWTTGAWLIWDYLERADPSDRRRLETCIAKGLIAWHGLPFTTHSELMSPDLFRAGLSYGQVLDKRFGGQTIAGKMTDVPGHTLGIVPLMAEAGLKFLHIGVNTASPRPDLPDLFRWQAPCGSEIIVMYQNSYGDTQFVDGLPAGISFAHTEDNIGPQNVGQVVDVYRRLCRSHPKSEIRASTLDAFAETLWPHRDKLPVITEDPGDSWIHGAGADPVKQARYRALQRYYDALPLPRSPEQQEFGRKLALVAEHTCGVDIKTFLRDDQAWDRDAFETARETDPRFAYAEASWAEQRGYMDQALDALEKSDRDNAVAALKELDQQAPPPVHGGQRDQVDLGGWQIAIDTDQGTIAALTPPGGKTITGRDGALCRFYHETYDADDISAHMDAYLVHDEEWAILDHIKPGLDQAKSAISARHIPRLASMGVSGEQLALHLEIEGNVPGSSARITLCLTPGAEGLEIALYLTGKSPNRMPEAGFLTFTPATDGPWQFLRTGLWMPANTRSARGGGQLQAIFAARSGDLEIIPLDTPLVAPTSLPFMPFTPRPANYDKGLAFNLYNNKWGTNFPMWWEGDLRARFRLIHGLGD